MKIIAYTIREFIDGNLRGLTYKSRDEVRSVDDLAMFENVVLKPISGFGSPYKIISVFYTLEENDTESDYLSASQVKHYLKEV